MSTVGDQRENRPMTRGGQTAYETRFLETQFEWRFLIISAYIIWGFYMYMNTVYMHFAQLAPLRNLVFPRKYSHFFGPKNSPFSFSGGLSDVEPESLTVARSAERVCVGLNTCGPRNIKVRRKRVCCADIMFKVHISVYGV